MKNWHFLLFGILAVSALTFAGCDDDGDDTISTVNFTEDIYNLTTSDLSPIEVELAISPAAPTDSEIEIEITGADAGVAFSTDPAISGTTVVIPVQSGATTASFTFTPIEAGIEGQLTANLMLTSTGPGLTTGLTIESIITIVDVGADLPLMEDFAGCEEDPQQPIPDGWTEAVIQQNGEGSATWVCGDANFLGTNAVQVNAFVPGSADNMSSEVWLVTPRLNLTEATNPVLSFDVDRRFDPTADFPYPEGAYDVLISTDYSVSVANATWQRFEAGHTAMADNDPGTDNITNTGDLDLSAYNGEVIAIAFVYRAGAPASFDATILRVGNVSVTDN